MTGSANDFMHPNSPHMHRIRDNLLGMGVPCTGPLYILYTDISERTHVVAPGGLCILRLFACSLCVDPGGLICFGPPSFTTHDRCLQIQYAGATPHHPQAKSHATLDSTRISTCCRSWLIVFNPQSASLLAGNTWPP